MPICRRYGQEQEDRQWDSGGGGGGGQDYYNNYSSYYRQDGNQDRYENKLNRTRTKKSTSNKELTRGYSESVEEDVSVLELVNIYKFTVIVIVKFIYFVYTFISSVIIIR